MMQVLTNDLLKCLGFSLQIGPLQFNHHKSELVSGVHDEDAVRANTELAVRVCGGESNIQEVTEDGYVCRTNP